MPTYLVTGAAGFIGSHLADKLLSLGNKVIAVDSFYPYYDRSIKENNISHNSNNPNYVFVEVDVSDEKNLKEIIEKFNVEGIFHIAATAGVRYSIQNPKSYFENNVTSTLSVLNAAVDKKIKIVFASSSSVYGNPKFMPINEDHPTIPYSPYGASKVASEAICNAYSSLYNIPIVILRYFSVYGPRQRPDMAFNKFISAILKNEPIIINGDGNQTRDFTYIDDIVDGTIKAMEYNVTGVFNLGGGNRMTVNEVIKILEEVSGRNFEVKYVEKQKGDVSDTWADNSKAKIHFGFNPKFDVKKGLEHEFKWMKNILK